MRSLFVVMILLTSNVHADSVVDIARSQLGQGEIGGNNRGQIVKKYTKGQEVAWCAAFVSWVLSRAGRGDNYFLRAKSFWEAYPNRRVILPRPGDIIVFKRGHQSGHVGIVEKVYAGTITTIEGNVGRYPAKVKRMTYKLGHIKNLIGFVRI